MSDYVTVAHASSEEQSPIKWFVPRPSPFPFPTTPIERDTLSSSDGLADTETTLSRVEVSRLTTGNGFGFFDDFFAFGEDEFDVAGVGHVWVDLIDVSEISLALDRIKHTRP